MTSARVVLRAARQRLTAAGVASPAVDSELLLAHCLHIDRAQLGLVDEVPADVVADFDILLAGRERREPLQYLVGHVSFRHITVAVGPGVFIPRPETELLVDAVLPALRAAINPIVVDLCAGSGVLALAIADEISPARVWAVEDSPAALAWLVRNAVGTGVVVIDSNVTDPTLLAHLTGSVDAVVSNPPYVPCDTPVAPEVRADPAEAVFAGQDGLLVMPAVINRAAQLLRPGGVLAVEHDDSHGEAVPRLLVADGRWRAVGAHHDLSGRPRYAVALRR